MFKPVSSDMHEYTGFAMKDPLAQSQRTRLAMEQIQSKHESVRQGIDKNLDQALRKIQHTADIFNTKLSFSVHQNTHRIVVRIINSETNQVIKQIPSQEIIDVTDQIQKILGMFVDRTS